MLKRVLFVTAWLWSSSLVAAEESDVGHQKVVTASQALVMGLVEGLTEYLPVSSTGHLVLVDHFMGLRDQNVLSPEQLEAMEAFEIVIQGGAILAVLLLYLRHVREMLLGLVGRNKAGRRLLFNIVCAFVPTAIMGLLLNKIIKSYLQFIGPVVAALAVGGVVMIVFERTNWGQKSRAAGRPLEGLSIKEAVLIGCIQCLAMWPGTSRSMVTILGGMVVGLSPVAAAEFSFLLGLPTLLAATVFKLKKDGHLLAAHINPGSMVIGCVVAAVTAAFAVRFLVAYLNRRGLAVFGWYRLILAAVVFAFLR